MGNFTETTYIPIPSHIARQLAVDLLHNHSEIIQLNPLVIGHEPIGAPQNAETDEYYCTWYSSHERIQYIPGTGKAGAGKISFNGVFHNLPTGLQTHIYAAAGVDLRHSYYIAGNQPGEMLEARELGSSAPASGLYLKEDKEIKCNKLMLSFVKKQLREATDILISRLAKKAELVDAGVLHAMMENGQLKTTNPKNRTSMISAQSPPDQLMEFAPSNSNGSSTQPSTLAESQDTLPTTQRYSQPSHTSAPQHGGLGFALEGNISLEPVQSPIRKQDPVAEQTAYREVPAESVRHELPAAGEFRSQGLPAPQAFALFELVW